MSKTNKYLRVETLFKISVCQVCFVMFTPFTSQSKPHAKKLLRNYLALPTRHHIQDKKVALTKNGILKITAEKKEEVNGKPSVQRAVLRDGGSNSADNFVQICTLLPRRKFSEAATSQSRWDVVCHRRAKNGSRKI